MILALMTPSLAFVVALWRRLIAGVWLVIAGCYFPFGMLAERNYMIHDRGFTDGASVQQTIVFALRITLPLVAFGLFAVVTEKLQWPKLLGRRTEAIGGNDSSDSSKRGSD